MTDRTILTATATYRNGEPTEGLHLMLDQARKLEAEVQVDSDRGVFQIVLTVQGPRDTGNRHELSTTLAALAEALPPGAATETASWRHTGPIPF